MSLLKALRQVIVKLDLFAHSQLLRFKGDADSKTFTGGLVSAAVLLFLVITFWRMAIDTMNRVLISSTTQLNHLQQPSPIYYSTQQNGSGYMLGIEVWGYDLASSSRYFDIELRNSVLRQGILQNQTSYYEMEPCTKQHWSSLSNHSVIYDKLQMQRMLCLPLNITLETSGGFISDIQRTIDIQMRRCTNSSNQRRPCAPQAEIDQVLNDPNSLVFAVYFINPSINPESSTYLRSYMQASYYGYFGGNFGLAMTIRNSKYSITTDESILPFEATHSEEGPIASSVDKNFLSISNESDTICWLSIERSGEDIIVNRSYQKIIDVFSYIGGLLGSILILLTVFNLYNQNHYELFFARSITKPQDDSPSNLADYNIFYFLLQTLYSLFRSLKIKCGWKSVQFFQKAKSEIVKQLDILLLFRRIDLLERALSVLFSKPQLIGLLLQQQKSVSQLERSRKMYKINQKVKKTLVQRIKDSKDESKVKTKAIQTKEMNSKREHKAGVNLASDLSAKKEIDYQNNLSKKHKQNQSEVSQQSSQSQESERQENQIEQQELIEALLRLQAESTEQNAISKAIYVSLDFPIKQLLETQNIQNTTSAKEQFIPIKPRSLNCKDEFIIHQCSQSVIAIRPPPELGQNQSQHSIHHQIQPHFTFLA